MSAVILPAITLHQPYACLIEIGAKPYETRPKRPPAKLIGQRIAIHAGLRKIRPKDFDNETWDAIGDEFGNCIWHEILPLGAIVCTATLAEVLPAESVPRDPFGDYRPGRWAWRLEDVRPIKPHVPARGFQQYGWNWIVPEGVAV